MPFADRTAVPDDTLNFERYALARPKLVSSQAEIPPRPGELGQLVGVVRNSIALIGQCLRIMAGILWRRLRRWFLSKVVHSLMSAWTLAGVGWGAFTGTFVLQLLAS